MDINSIKDDFTFLEDWEDRYRYVIELGKALPPFEETLRTEDNKVAGCVSQVWLATQKVSSQSPEGPVLRFSGDSDAMIVRGLVAILIAIFNDKPATEILNIDAEGILSSLGLKEHLTPQRSNGLSAMVERIRTEAARAIGE